MTYCKKDEYTNDEIIDKVLEFSVKIKTNKGNEKIVHFSDIKAHINSYLSHYYDDNDGLTKIKFELDCLGFSMAIIDV